MATALIGWLRKTTSPQVCVRQNADLDLRDKSRRNAIDLIVSKCFDTQCNVQPFRGRRISS